MGYQTNLNQKCKYILSQNLKKCRELHSLSIRELSNETGIPATYLATLENKASETINFAVLVTLAHYFRVSIDSLIENEFMIPPQKEKIKTYY